MANLPTNFRKASETAVASYAYTEIASGLGFSTFYLLYSFDNASSAEYVLIDSNTIHSFAPNGEVGGGTKTENYDTSTFNLPRTIKGTAYFNLGYKTDADTTGTISATLYKWDGTTETVITSTHTETIGASEDGNECFKMPCTQTLIKAGEQIRLKLVVVDGGGTGKTYFGHDPTNSAGANIDPATHKAITASNINIPFKLDL